jgi:hypothetical protein
VENVCVFYPHVPSTVMTAMLVGEQKHLPNIGSGELINKRSFEVLVPLKKKLISEIIRNTCRSNLLEKCSQKIKYRFQRKTQTWYKNSKLWGIYLLRAKSHKIEATRSL